MIFDHETVSRSARIVRRALSGLALGAFCIARADPPITLSGNYTSNQEYECTSDTVINFRGATFTDCRLKLAGDVKFTFNLENGTQNVFTRESGNDYCIKATRQSNIVITGGGSLEIVSKKLVDHDDEGLLTCNNLTVTDGDISVTVDAKPKDGDTKFLPPCIWLKGNYLQTGGKMKVDGDKKNCTNEFSGVHFETAGTSFTLQDGTFNAEMGGTKSRAIDLKKSCTAMFKGGKCKMEFEGPNGRFVSGGTIVFEGGEFNFTTNFTAKMTNPDFYPVYLSAVKADYSITITGGDFEADLPLEGSEVFTTDSATGESIDISGGTFDLVAGDDCISANGQINITGGNIRAVSVLDDALDANGNISISGGSIRAYATAPGTHGLDVNKGWTLTISGGIVIATDGVGAVPIGANDNTVGKKNFKQPTYYGTLPTTGYSSKYLCLDGMTNNVAFTVKPCLPAFPSGNDFNLLVSVPGRAASVPDAKSVTEAYANANSSTPIVFEKKATVAGHTVTTREGAVLEIPSYYDLSPASGKTKVIELALNNLAVPEYADIVTDGVAAIAVGGDGVRVGVRTHNGLKYQLRTADSPSAADADWTNAGGIVAGNGAVKTLTTPAGASGFFKVRVTD